MKGVVTVDDFGETGYGELVCAEARLIQLPGHIDEAVAQRINRGFYELAKQGDAAITLLISSGGGGVYAATSIADTIAHVRSISSVKVVGRVHGYAMSAAIYPLLACDERESSPNAMFMVHGMRDSQLGLDMNAMRAEQAANEELVRMQSEWLGARTKRAASDWIAILNESTPRYYTAAQALEEGLVDSVT